MSTLQRDANTLPDMPLLLPTCILAHRMNALFWTDYFNSSYSIWRANLDGSNAEPILAGLKFGDADGM